MVKNVLMLGGIGWVGVRVGDRVRVRVRCLVVAGDIRECWTTALRKEEGSGVAFRL